MKGPLFFAKILLFGEYGIIKDSKGLSIPYNFYRGALKIPDGQTQANEASHLKLRFYNVFKKTGFWASQFWLGKIRSRFRPEDVFW